LSVNQQVTKLQPSLGRLGDKSQAILVDWSCEYENLPLQGRLYLPADEAFDLGFMGADERRHAIAGAHAATVREMTGLLDILPGHNARNCSKQ